MNETQEVTRSQAQEAQQTGEQPQRRPGEYRVPPVDVFEDESGITLSADMPGVSGERLNLQVDRNTLLIEGEVALDLPEGIEALYAEIRTTGYRRSFALSSELDTDKIQANLKDGVLTLKLPKKEKYQPRKIQVQTI